MKHFNFLTQQQIDEIFFKPPKTIDFHTRKNTPFPPKERLFLANALGATLYMPATRQDIATLILSATHATTSYVFCLEDSIGDTQIECAEQNLLQQLNILQKELATMDQTKKATLPLLFIRIRTPEHLRNFGEKLGPLLQIIDGFSLPKADMRNLTAYFNHLIALSQQAQTWLWALPILESDRLMDKINRIQELSNIYDLFTQPTFEERILNIRIGITDLCGLFGLRRPYDTNIYDISLIRDFITDVLNIFLLNCRFVISGGVWEYFQQPNHLSLNLEEKNSPKSQPAQKILPKEIVGLIKEVQMDQSNGLIGKTCIHPTHILPINSQLIVSQENYLDAKQITSHSNGETGAFKSEQGNKMNELNPHLLWAKKTLTQATIYGVYHAQKNYRDLLAIANTTEETQ